MLSDQMRKASNWSHKWFGVWREFGRGYENCPSIHDFVGSENSPTYDVGRQLLYLETAHVIAATSRMNFPCVITGTVFHGSLCVRTDGVWWWHDDLGHYIKKHRVFLPPAMVAVIEENNYSPPSVSDEQISQLDRSM